jgi:ferric-dicitrate binding protein FerR (iron transport regulator)
MTLAPSTTVHTTMDAKTQALTVTVDGEALFHVVHRARAPFLVRTRNALTYVLGTTFSVRQYAADPASQVVVVDGRVSLRSLRYPNAVGTVMAAGTLGTIDDSGRVNVTPNVPAGDYTAWATGRLVFQQAPARQVVADLSRAYGVTIHIADSALAQRTVTWSIPVTHITLGGALNALTMVINAHVVRSGDTLTVVPGRAARTWPRHQDSLSMQEHTYGR